MVIGVIGSVTNLLFVYLFLFDGLIPGVNGMVAVALGNTVSAVIVLGLSVAAFLCLKCPIRLCIRKKHIKSLLCTGVPAGLSGLSYMLAQTITTSFMGIIGITALNAKSYVATIIQYTSLVSGAVGTGVGILMGRYAGKNEFDKMKKLSRTALLFAIGANVLFSLSVYFLRIPLISAFTENTEIYSMITPIFLY